MLKFCKILDLSQLIKYGNLNCLHCDYRHRIVNDSLIAIIFLRDIFYFCPRLCLIKTLVYIKKKKVLLSLEVNHLLTTRFNVYSKILGR